MMEAVGCFDAGPTGPRAAGELLRLRHARCSKASQALPHHVLSRG